VLHDACRRRDLASASLWAAVPHYVAAVPNPKAALALLRRLEGLTGIAIEGSELEDASERFDEQIDRAVAANPEIEQLVRRLEEEQAEELELGEGASGDDIASEFQRFLRQRGDDAN
jgi:proteasome assembly chaperone (PAC2) family protein